MNFINGMEGEEVQVELKYCERCGGLWLRLLGADAVYCGGRRLHLAAMPDPGEAPPRKARRRRKVQAETGDQGDLQSSTRIDYLQGVAAMEVRA
jgi:Zn-finger nucleic acid-binding protein